ncbi:MAG: hypothetical protein Q3999_01725 [Buchananella hordeovulneris]|nr:hypothetical protein [Buchananella hordeovulneris]
MSNIVNEYEQAVREVASLPKFAAAARIERAEARLAAASRALRLAA